MNEKTFGSTPAAMYLARVLNELGDESLNRSVGRRITNTTNAVNDLVYSYSIGFLPSKTVANCLRLMREEIVNEISYEVNYEYNTRSSRVLVDKLRRNVQIGAIKRGIRLCQVARKAEKVMTRPAYFDGSLFFRDKPSGKVFEGGRVIQSDDKEIRIVRTFGIGEVSDVTPELLVERSNKRCKRLGKAHMKDVV